MEPNINIEEIEQYLEGALQGEVLEAFEQRLQSDPKLAARVKLLRKLDPVLEDEQALEVQKAVLNLGAEFFSEENQTGTAPKVRRIPLYRRPLAIAAAILLLVAIGFVIQMQLGGTMSNQELYTAYYQPFEANELSRGAETGEDLYQQAIQKYTVKDFQGAISNFNQILSENPGDIQTKFALAHAFLNQSPANLDEAATYFRQVIDDGKSILVPKAQWYLALIELEQDNPAGAKQLLEALISSEDDKVVAKAKELLEELK